MQIIIPKVSLFQCEEDEKTLQEIDNLAKNFELKQLKLEVAKIQDHKNHKLIQKIHDEQVREDAELARQMY